MKKLAPTVTFAVAALLAAGSAQAHPHPVKTVKYTQAKTGAWHFNANRCPDLVEDRLDRREDRRDSRVVTGVRDLREDRRDRAENRRDEAVINCPSSAWVWKGAAYNATLHPSRPANVIVYYNPGKAKYYRRVGTRTIIVDL